MSWFKKFLCSWFHIGCPDPTTTTSTTSNIPTTSTTPTTTTLTTTQAPFIQISGQQLINKGKPFKFIADNPWTLPEMIGATNKLELYLDTRKKQGFDTVVFWVMGSWFDKTVKNPKENMFARSDRVMNELEKRDMYAIMCPSIFQWDSDKQDNILVLPLSECYELGRVFGNRYKNRKNLIAYMAMAFDAHTIMPASSVMETAKGIRNEDPNHIIMLGPRMHYTTTSYYPVGPCHQIPAYASFHKYTIEEIKPKMNEIAATGMPFANMEGPAFGEDGIGADKITAFVNITKPWNVCGFVYIDSYIYPFKSGWENQLNNAGVKAFLSAVK